jgi:hypothetical protein
MRLTTEDPRLAPEILRRAGAHATAYLDGLADRPVGPTVGPSELRRRLARPLPDDPSDPALVIEELVRDLDGSLMGSTGGRFFGWVIGGVLPVALASDWLTSAWDQNAASSASSPAAAVVEEICGGWLRTSSGCRPRSPSASSPGVRWPIRPRSLRHGIGCCGIAGSTWRPRGSAGRPP